MSKSETYLGCADLASGVDGSFLTLQLDPLEHSLDIIIRPRIVCATAKLSLTLQIAHSHFITQDATASNLVTVPLRASYSNLVHIKFCRDAQSNLKARK